MKSYRVHSIFSASEAAKDTAFPDSKLHVYIAAIVTGELILCLVRVFGSGLLCFKPDVICCTKIYQFWVVDMEGLKKEVLPLTGEEFSQRDCPVSHQAATGLLYAVSFSLNNPQFPTALGLIKVFVQSTTSSSWRLPHCTPG